MKRLIIFLKEPVPGQVKTRLGQTLGAAAAAEVARICGEVTLAQLKSLQSETVIAVHPPEAVTRVQQWLGSDWKVVPQQGDDLGARLHHATEAAFADGAQRVLVIGTDSPWLSVADVQTAWEYLAAHDLVIGPTEDGGYYLIGLSAPRPELFQEIAWGTETVATHTRARAQQLGLRVRWLTQGYDIDRAEDLRHFVHATQVAEPFAEAVQRLEPFVQEGASCRS